MAKKKAVKKIEKPALVGTTKEKAILPATKEEIAKNNQEVKKETGVVNQLQEKLNLEILRSRSLSDDKVKLEKELKDQKDLVEAMVFQTLTSKLYYEQLTTVMERQKK